MEEPSPIIRALANVEPNEPLTPDDPRFADLDAVRGFALHEELGAKLQAAAFSKRYLRIAVAGHRGSGKSTELNRTAEDLAAKGYVVLKADVDQLLDIHDFSFSDVIRVLLLLLDDFFGGEVSAKPLLHEAFEIVRAWYTDITREHERAVKDATEFGLAAGLGGTQAARVGIFGLQYRTELGKLQMAYNVLSRGESADKLWIRERVERYQAELIENLNLLLRSLRQHLPERTGAGIVFILDGIDKCESKVVNQALLRPAELFRSIDAHLIFTIQAALLRNPPEGSVHDAFKVGELPMLPVFERRSRTPRADVIARIRQAVYQRVPPELFAEGDVAVDELILQSGGCWRDLLRLLEEALLEARERVSAENRRRARNVVALAYQRLIQSDEQVRILAETHLTHEVNSDKDTLYLLFHRCLLEYNGDGWRDVHPLLESYGPFQRQLKALRTVESS